MNRSRITGDLVSQNNIFVDIANDRVGIGSTIPGEKLSLPDSAKIALGDSADLKLYHNTSDYIQSSSQYFYIGGENVMLTNAAANEITLKAIQNGAVELYHNNSKKFETSSTGSETTGGLLVDTVDPVIDVGNTYTYKYGYFGDTDKQSLTVRGNEACLEVFASDQSFHGGSIILRGGNEGFGFVNNSSADTLELINFTASANSFALHNGGANLSNYKKNIEIHKNGAVELYHNNIKKLETSSTGATVTGKLTSDGLVLGDAETIAFGNTSNGDLKIYHDGSNGSIQNITGNLHIFGGTNSIFLKAKNDENSVACAANAQVELYYNGTKRFETLDTGAKVTGTQLLLDGDGSSAITGTPHTYNYGRGDGDSSVLSLYGSESAIEIVSTDDGTHGGSLLLRTVTDGAALIYNPTDNALEIKTFAPSSNNFAVHNNGSHTDQDTQLRVVKDGAVELNYNGGKKLETNTDGVQVTGSTGSFLKIRTSSGYDSGIVLTVNNDDNTDWSIRNDQSDSNILDFRFNGSRKMDLASGGDLTLTDNTADANAGPEFKLFRNSASPADADYLGQIKFAGENDNDEEINYAKITGKILDASDGTEDGILEFAHIKAGTQTITGRFRSDSLQLLNGTNFSVAGTSEFTGNITATGDINANDHINLASGKKLSMASDVFKIYHSTNAAIINESGDLLINQNVSNKDIKISTGSGPAERLHIKSDGKIGINASSPDCMLHVVKASAGTMSADGNAVLALENSNHCVLNMMSPADKSSYIMMGDPDDTNAGQIRYDNNTDNLMIEVNGDERFRITSDGKINVGNAISSDPWSRTGNTNTGVRLAQSTTSYAISANSNEIVAIFNRTSGTGNGTILELKYDNVVVASLASNFNSFTQNITIDSNSSASLGLDRGNTSSGAVIDFKTNGSVKWYMGLRGLVNDNFYIRNESGSTDALTILTNGRVGVNHTAPTAPLDVKGADSGINIRSDANDRPHLNMINGSTTMLRISCNGSLVDFGDGNSTARYMKLNPESNHSKIRMQAQTYVDSSSSRGGVYYYGAGFQYTDDQNNDHPILHVQATSNGGGVSNIVCPNSKIIINGKSIGGSGRSWKLTVIKGSGSNIGQVIHHQTYDVYGNGTSEATNYVNALSTYTTDNNLIIVTTSDEPEGSAGAIRTALRDTYGAKDSMYSYFRYAYAFAFRHGFGTLGEQNSIYWSALNTRAGGGSNNIRTIACINFTVCL